MVSGRPVSDEEREKIFEFHRAGTWPSDIARYLSKYYPHLNGGYRSTETVKDIIKAAENPPQEIIPPEEPLPDLSPAGEPEPAPQKKVPDLRKGKPQPKKRLKAPQGKV